MVRFAIRSGLFYAHAGLSPRDGKSGKPDLGVFISTWQRSRLLPQETETPGHPYYFPPSHNMSPEEKGIAPFRPPVLRSVGSRLDELEKNTPKV